VDDHASTRNTPQGKIHQEKKKKKKKEKEKVLPLNL
jgi:hypothetical protein